MVFTSFKFIRDNLDEHIVSLPHWHDCFELLYMLEGTAQQQVNDKYFVVNKHDLIIINDGVIHSTSCVPGEDVRMLVVKFLPDIIHDSYSRIFESKYILAFLNNRNNQLCHMADTIANSKNIYQLMMGLFEEFSNKESGYEIFIKGYIFQLIACLVRNGKINLYHPFGAEHDLLKLDKVFKYIEGHYKERIDLREASDMLNLSYSYFSRYFKKVTGRTFKEYIDFVRISEVEKLILSQRMNISQAAYESGFCNVTSFNRVFKRVRGYLPGDIKRSKTAKK